MTFLSPSHPCFASNSEPKAEPAELATLVEKLEAMAWRASETLSDDSYDPRGYIVGFHRGIEYVCRNVIPALKANMAEISAQSLAASRGSRLAQADQSSPTNSNTNAEPSGAREP